VGIRGGGGMGSAWISRHEIQGGLGLVLVDGESGVVCVGVCVLGCGARQWAESEMRWCGEMGKTGGV
jgi:hypothetical protein